MLIPVIIAGGVGSRLWPLSRASRPKQFADFPGLGGTLFQETLGRLEGLEGAAAPVVVCGREHEFLAAEQLRGIGLETSGAARMLLEPCGRGTAPAVALAALRASADSILLVLPADHIITKPEAFHAAVAKGLPLAKDGKLVTFGITPAEPETGYGYIERGSKLGGGAYAVADFTEKPDEETARRYLKSKKYFWNSGMFLFGARRYLQELQQFAPKMLAVCRKALNGDSINEDLFASCPADSVDYAVMEKTADGVVIRLDAGWSDLGSWDAVWRTRWEGDNGDDTDTANTLGTAYYKDAHDSYIYAGSRLVAALGVEDLVIVETADAVLVADRYRSQEVKDIVAELQKDGREEAWAHPLVHRPWGSYESLAAGEGYQVKHITVNPGAALSLQKHARRAERWTVIEGRARVTCDDEEFVLAPGESASIPLGSKHRLENPGDGPLRVIEVQTGDYFGEDDIVRYEDRYGRV